MSSYKVIQDIEAEDKLIGPLSFRQFVYALVAAFCFYICFLCLTKGAAFLLIIFLPPGLAAAFFAAPFGKDQPTEIWALAKIRFLFKPRRRIWDQSGVKELVTITAPKKVEEARTDGLSQGEIKSRLSALANTIDSRGWAVKNVNLNLDAASPQAASSGSDRLLSASGLPQDVSVSDIRAADDIMDEQNNPIAHQFDEMIDVNERRHREQLEAMMQHDTTQAVSAQPQATPSSYWFVNQPTPSQARVTTQPAPTTEEEALAEHLKQERAKPNTANAHLKTIQPLGVSPQAAPAPQPASQPTTPTQPSTAPKPLLQQLSARNDLTIATLAHQAQNSGSKPREDGEVVIALH